MFEKLAEDIENRCWQKLAYLVKQAEDDIGNTRKDIASYDKAWSPKPSEEIIAGDDFKKQVEEFLKALMKDHPKITEDYLKHIIDNGGNFYPVVGTSLYPGPSGKHEYILKGLSPNPNAGVRNIEQVPSYNYIPEADRNYPAPKPFDKTKNGYSGPILGLPDGYEKSLYEYSGKEYNQLAQRLQAEKFFNNLTLPSANSKSIGSGFHGLPVNIPEHIMNMAAVQAGGIPVNNLTKKGVITETDPRISDTLLNRVGDMMRYNYGYEFDQGLLDEALKYPSNGRWRGNNLTGNPLGAGAFKSHRGIDDHISDVVLRMAKEKGKNTRALNDGVMSALVRGVSPVDIKRPINSTLDISENDKSRTWRFNHPQDMSKSEDEKDLDFYNAMSFINDKYIHETQPKYYSADSSVLNDVNKFNNYMQREHRKQERMKQKNVPKPESETKPQKNMELTQKIEDTNKS